jgi:hypothetical protein
MMNGNCERQGLLRSIMWSSDQQPSFLQQLVKCFRIFTVTNDERPKSLISVAADLLSSGPEEIAEPAPSDVTEHKSYFPAAFVAFLCQQAVLTSPEYNGGPPSSIRVSYESWASSHPCCSRKPGFIEVKTIAVFSIPRSPVSSLWPSLHPTKDLNPYFRQRPNDEKRVLSWKFLQGMFNVKGTGATYVFLSSQMKDDLLSGLLSGGSLTFDEVRAMSAVLTVLQIHRGVQLQDRNRRIPNGFEDPAKPTELEAYITIALVLDRRSSTKMCEYAIGMMSRSSRTSLLY